MSPGSSSGGGRASAPIEQTSPSALDHWRERILATTLLFTFGLGLITAAPSVVFAASEGLWHVVVIDVIALAWVATIALVRSLPYLLRAISLIVVCAGLGFFFLFEVGAASQIYLMAAPVLAGLLLGLRAGVLTVVAASVGFFTLGYLVGGDLHLTKYEADPLLKWALIALNFAFISAVLTISSAVLVRALDGAVRRQRAIARSLTEEQALLSQANEELAREIADRERAEEQARRLAEAVEQAHDVILLTDADGRVNYANPAFQTIFSQLRGAVVIDRLQDLPTAQGAADAIDAALRAGRSWSGTVVVTSTAGGQRELEAVVSPIRDDHHVMTSAVAVLRDVTQERELAARLRQSHKLEALGTLAGGIAHDFNNIVGAILAISEHLRANLRGDPLGDDVDHILIACERARGIVSQMLTFSRQTAVERSSLPLKPLVEEAVSLLRAALPASIRFEIDLRSNAATRVHPGEVHQLLMNLGTNAQHAMLALGGGVLAVTLDERVADDALARSRPRLRAGERYLCLEVRDTGGGVPAEHLERIFDPFFTTKEPGQGTGLGLATVHGIVTGQGGDIEVVSAVGEGTTFRIFLPAEEPSEPLAAAPAAPTRVEPAAQTARVLFVDDEMVIRTIGRRLLEGLGFAVTTAGDGIAARAIFDEQPDGFDVLVTDLTMPGASGVELIRHVRERRPDLPVILTSGFGEAVGPEVLESLRLDAFLQKPYTQQELLSRIARAIHREAGA